jgi:hypothetical protein
MVRPVMDSSRIGNKRQLSSGCRDNSSASSQALCRLPRAQQRVNHASIASRFLSREIVQRNIDEVLKL